MEADLSAGTVAGTAAGTDHEAGVRVSPADLRRAAADVTAVCPHCAEDQALATAGRAVADKAPATLSTTAAAQVVDATRAGMRDLNDCALDLARALIEAATAYQESDDRAAARIVTGPPGDRTDGNRATGHGRRDNGSDRP